jgi:hypothetical protein
MSGGYTRRHIRDHSARAARTPLIHDRPCDPNQDMVFGQHGTLIRTADNIPTSPSRSQVLLLYRDGMRHAVGTDLMPEHRVWTKKDLTRYDAFFRCY